jgi:DNA invertase Pin-like site-specific DNA recombinase
MANGRFVAYYRVSTQRQGRSGLGLEAQEQSVHAYLNGGRWSLLDSFTEIESGKRTDRPELERALAACRIHNATLVIAKLDRLARDAHFLLGLQKARVQFVAADMPEANDMVVGIMAVVAQGERKMISDRTKAALKAAKTRGVKLGGDRGNIHLHAQRGAERSALIRHQEACDRSADLVPVIHDVQTKGAKSLRQIASELNSRGIQTARGGAWSAVQVQRVLARA